ncbi:MAG: hypothetical protein GXX81_07760 [Acidobacteria bacterium]|nr:hypothetical protein [Acidobacteriota bacterium]
MASFSGLKRPPVTYATVPPTATQGRVTARGTIYFLERTSDSSTPRTGRLRPSSPSTWGIAKAEKARSVRRRLNRTRLLAICFGVVIPASARMLRRSALG